MRGLCPDCGAKMEKVSVIRAWGERGKEDIQKNLWFCEKCDAIWNREKRDPDTFRPSSRVKARVVKIIKSAGGHNLFDGLVALGKLGKPRVARAGATRKADASAGGIAQPFGGEN